MLTSSPHPVHICIASPFIYCEFHALGLDCRWLSLRAQVRKKYLRYLLERSLPLHFVCGSVVLVRARPDATSRAT